MSQHILSCPLIYVAGPAQVTLGNSAQGTTRMWTREKMAPPNLWDQDSPFSGKSVSDLPSFPRSQGLGLWGAPYPPPPADLRQPVRIKNISSYLSQPGSEIATVFPSPSHTNWIVERSSHFFFFFEKNHWPSILRFCDNVSNSSITQNLLMFW